MINRIRINKYLSLCGLGSRRKVEDYILNRKIKINDKVIDSLSATIDPNSDIVSFNNKRLNIINKKYYLIFNKPRGCITTVNDDYGRSTVMDFISEKYKRAGIFPVGRLDKDSEGLLFLTNDGDVAYKLMHPKFNIQKEYIVEIDNPLDDGDKIKMANGAILYGKRTSPAEIIPLDHDKKTIKIKITEGKKRHIRLIFSKFSYRVKKLKRISLGPLRLGNLKQGTFRLLSRTETAELHLSLK